MDKDIKDLHIALDLARFLADSNRLNSNLNDNERKLADTIAQKIKQYLTQGNQ